MENQTINTDLFILEWGKIKAKLDLISKVESRETKGKDFESFTVEDGEFIYKTSTSWGGETENYYMYIPIEEINESIEFFEQKEAAYIEAERLRKAESERKKKLAQEERDLRDFERLKAKLGK